MCVVLNVEAGDEVLKLSHTSPLPLRHCFLNIVIRVMGIVERIRMLLETRKHKKFDVNKEFDRHGYRFIRCLSRGRFGSTYLAETKDDNLPVAIKVIEESDCMIGEKHLWQHIHHQYCVSLYERFNVKGYAIFVCEYASNSDIMTWLQKRDETLGPHLEALARRVTEQILMAFDHCHGQDLAHLDFKWTNVLIDDAFNVKLTGFCYMCSKANAEGICLGDSLYQPPEALTTGVSRCAMDKVDMWQLGAALIHMLLGWYIPVLNAPQDSRISDVALAMDTRSEVVQLPRKLSTCGVSTEALNFLEWILKYRPEDRPTTREALNHPWLTEGM